MKKKKIVITLYLDYEPQEFSRKPLNSGGKNENSYIKRKGSFLNVSE